MQESISILLVDDEEKLLNRLARILTEEHYTVDCATNVEDGITKLSTENYDILLTDLNMPRQSGFELMSFIKNNNLETLPLVLTGYASVEGAIRAIKLGAYDFLEKPVDSRTLKHTLKRAAERVILKQENENHIKELQKLNHLKNEFLSIVSHDIRSPLSSIGGFANHLLKKGELNELQEHYLLIISTIADNLYSLVNEVLDISKIEQGFMKLDYEDTDIDELINCSLNNFILHSVDKNNRLEFYNRMDDQQVNLDRMKMLQVLNNLINNAIKFTENGKITLTAEEDKEGFISISVLDTGIGMNEKEITGLFDQYNYHHTAGTRGEKGNGLGITICKRFVELHGGTIEVKSTPGTGTEFIIKIPRDGNE